MTGGKCAMRLTLVSNLVPDSRPLSEHGYHTYHALRRSRPEYQVCAVSGHHPGDASDGVHRHYHYGSPMIAQQILASLQRLRPDAVFFNMHYTAWGGNLANVSALLAPLLARRAGRRVISLLHHVPHTINASLLGYRLTPLHWAAIEVVSHAIARAGTVLFTNQRDHDSFRRYRPARSGVVPLSLPGRPAYQPAAGADSVLTLGAWGRSKDPEPLVTAALNSRRRFRLVVAGASSHTRPGFVERLRVKYAPYPQISFPGYVPELALPEYYRRSLLVVLLHREMTGQSGTLLQACQYGRVPLVPRLPLFEATVRQYGIKAHFFDNERDLGAIIDDLLGQRDALVEAGYENYRAIQWLSVDNIAGQYWHAIERDVVVPSTIPAGAVGVVHHP
jgi:glycosyltransferase involved in cell wall biosynthesis